MPVRVGTSTLSLNSVVGHHRRQSAVADRLAEGGLRRREMPSLKMNGSADSTHLQVLGGAIHPDQGSQVQSQRAPGGAQQVRDLPLGIRALACHALSSRVPPSSICSLQRSARPAAGFSFDQSVVQGDRRTSSSVLGTPHSAARARARSTARRVPQLCTRVHGVHTLTRAAGGFGLVGLPVLGLVHGGRAGGGVPGDGAVLEGVLPSACYRLFVAGRQGERGAGTAVGQVGGPDGAVHFVGAGAG